MKLRALSFSTLVCSLALIAGQAIAGAAPTPAASGIPHLQKAGGDHPNDRGRQAVPGAGRRFEDSTSSSLDNMRPIWPTMVQMNLNTVLPVVYWGLLEPEEGKFDFTLVDGMIREARSHKSAPRVRVVRKLEERLSLYAPVWAKTDFKRFPRAHDRAAKGWSSSPLSRATAMPPGTPMRELSLP